MFKDLINGRLFIAIILIIGTIIAVPNLVEDQSPNEILVIQSITGDLKVFTEQGPHWQGFGKVTSYPRQQQVTFCSDIVFDKNGEIVSEELCKGATSKAKRLRFNDGGHAFLNGSVNWEMPLDAESIIHIHKQFNSTEAVEKRAIEKMLDSAVYLTGPLMSSTESSGSRRSELVQNINDQAENGVYVTHVKNIITKDAMSGQDVSVAVTEIERDATGNAKRQQGSLINEFKLQLQPLAINELIYDKIVENQIKQRQEATTSVQISQANAIKAEQDAITAAKQGEAKAATAKWAQEVLKATAVTKAQQDLEVAQLATKEAEQFKQAEILKGQGEAEHKRLVMNADGALEPKLKALIEINKNYAVAIAEAKSGAWTPNIMLGGNGGGTNGAGSLIEAFLAKSMVQTGTNLDIVKH